MKLNPYLLLGMFLGLLTFIVVVGATLLFLSFKVAKLPPLPFQKHLLAVLAGISFGYLLSVALFFGGPPGNRSPEGQMGYQLGILCIAEVLVVPLVLRRFTPRALVTQILAVLLANAVAFGAFLLINRWQGK